MSIVIITNDRHQVFQRDIIIGVEHIAEQYGYDVLVDSSADTPFMYPSLTSHQMTGIIVIANVLDDEQLLSLHALNKPITLVSHRVPGLPIPAVIQNNTDGIHKLVDYLVEDCGRQELVFIQGNMEQHDGIARQGMVEQRLMHHNLMIPPERMLRGDFEAEIATASMREFLEQDIPFDAVIAADYVTGCAIVEVLREAGISVGDEVCVVGFGDGQKAEDCGLTTVGTDIVELGQRAARQLVAQIEGTALVGVTWLTTELIERESSQVLAAAPVK